MALYDKHTGAEALASGLNQVRPESELESIAGRVHRLATNMEDTAARLREHADGVFGPAPECEGTGTPTGCRSGQLGSLHDALDRLERVHGYVAEQAARNCTLA